MKIVIIDNYDSFTYNLAHVVKSQGAEVHILRNDRFAMQDLQPFDGILLSPGPGIPSEAGLLLDVIRTYAGVKPILGVCLGHQAIAEVFGGKLRNLTHVYHGIATPITLSPDPLFAELPPHVDVGRYHSWVVDETDLPAHLQVTARSDDDQIMALRHAQHNVRGIQFHPESILTPTGTSMLKNWLHNCIQP